MPRMKMKRPHIDPEIHKKVERMSKNLDIPQYEIYETLVDVLITESGAWADTSLRELKNEIGEESAV